MNKSYSRINWENYPSDSTPLNEYNLNKMDVSVDELDNRVITLDETKSTKIEVSPLFKEVSYDTHTGILTFTRKNGATVVIDTPMEKIQTGIYYDPTTEMLTLPLIDGTTIGVSLSRLITEYEFDDSETIAFHVGTNGHISAIVKEGSIQEKHLRPNYLADIKVEVAKAQASEKAAAISETNAKASETAAKVSETNAKASETAAKTSETNAAKSETAAKGSETNAKSSETAAKTSETNAKTSETNAASSATAAEKSATNAAKSETSAENSATSAETSADWAKSYAVGTNGDVRENDGTDNAKYYYEQAKHISQGMNGLTPMGTVTFENLPTADIVKNAMYNVSNDFTSDNRFLDGGGIAYGAGSNVYYTVDGKWDVLAASAVTGVKGNKETTYRQGNVNITPENIGALAENGDTNNNSTTFTSADSTAPTGWTNVAVLASGEKHSSLFNKISTMFKNVRWLYKMLGTTDISSIGGGTVTGALSALNTNFTQQITITGDFTSRWYVGHNIIGWGFVIVIPWSTKGRKIAISRIRAFTGAGWSTNLTISDIKTYEGCFIVICGSLSDMSAGTSYIAEVYGSVR